MLVFPGFDIRVAPSRRAGIERAGCQTADNIIGCPGSARKGLFLLGRAFVFQMRENESHFILMTCDLRERSVFFGALVVRAPDRKCSGGVRKPR